MAASNGPSVGNRIWQYLSSESHASRHQQSRLRDASGHHPKLCRLDELIKAGDLFFKTGLIFVLGLIPVLALSSQLLRESYFIPKGAVE